jgi:Na+/H+ antiporter NhaA
MSVAEEPLSEAEPGSRTVDLRAWSRRSESTIAVFARTETAGAAALLAAAVAALIWANVDLGSYERTWQTRLSVELGGSGVSMTVGGWVNSGLMSFFFFVVGLEARRELDIGELRERRRIVTPVLAGVGGMAAAVAVYLLVNVGSPGVHGWGAAMSTDTALALGVLALIRPPFPDRLRAFVLTVMVVDDAVALVVVATVYSGRVSWTPLGVAIGLVAVMVLLVLQGVTRGGIYFVLAIPAWVALSKSGIDPVVLGLVMGLLTYAAPAARADLERATDLFRGFREQPTPALARAVRVGLRIAVAPNERLEELFHPWTSFAVVPLFALANFGIPIDGSFLVHALGSPVTLGIALGYVLGKPLGVQAAAWLVARVSGGRLRAPVGWLAITGGGTLAGTPFTVSLLVASLAFRGPVLREAKLGILIAAIVSALLSWAVFRASALLSAPARTRALLGTARGISDLALPVDPERDHVRGPAGSLVTLVEYGDFECPYCGQAEPAVRSLLADFGDLRYVWRHLPLVDVHPRAKLAAMASEAAAAQGAFWPMHDLLLEHQDALRPEELVGYAERLGLDTQRFHRDLQAHIGKGRIAEDIEGADLSGVSGTPSFFINGGRYRGAYDLTTLTAAVKLAKAQAGLGQAVA